MYKKFVTRNGKRQGPYYYESVRMKNGKIKSIYVGRTANQEKLKQKLAKLHLDTENIVKKGETIVIPIEVTSPKRSKNLVNDVLALSEIFSEKVKTKITKLPELYSRDTPRFKKVQVKWDSNKAPSPGATDFEFHSALFLLLSVTFVFGFFFLQDDFIGLSVLNLNNTLSINIGETAEVNLTNVISSENDTATIPEVESDPLVLNILNYSCSWNSFSGNFTVCESVEWFGGNRSHGFITGGDSLKLARRYYSSPYTYCQNVGNKEGNKAVNAYLLNEKGNIIKSNTGEKIDCAVGEDNLVVLANETNETLEAVSEVNVNNETAANITKVINSEAGVEEVVQYQAVIGQPVKWKKKVKLDNPEINLEVKLPKEAKVTSVKKVENNEVIDITNEVVEPGNVVTGFSFLLTGFAILDEPTETILTIDQIVEEVEIEYETEAPQVFEEIVDGKKRVTISSETHYENILTYTSLPDVPEDAIKLYWLVNGSKVEHEIIEFKDTNGNSLIDEIYWVTPHLSNQTFEVSIEVLNVKSYPVVNGNWTVDFITTGTADLTITGFDGTDFVEDLSFLKLTCDNQRLTPTVNSSSIFLANYSCNGIGHEVSQVLTFGAHNLKFQFGDSVAYAYNDAGILEAGIIAYSGTGWDTVSLTRNYTFPIVLVKNQFGSETSSDHEVATAIASNATSSNFSVQARMENATIATNISYLVVENGSWDVNGVNIQAGLYKPVDFYDADGENPYYNIQFHKAYSSAPIVIANAMNDSAGDWITPRYDFGSINTTGVLISLEIDSSYGTGPIAATTVGSGLNNSIAWLAINQTNVTGFMEARLESQVDEDPGAGDFRLINFNQTYTRAPALFTIQEVNGGTDPTTVSLNFMNDSAVQIRLAEDRMDGEQSHAIEDVMWVAFEPTTVLSAIDIPTELECNNSTNCNLSVNTGVSLNASGSSTPERINLTYMIEAARFNNTISLDAESGEQQVIGQPAGFTVLGETGILNVSNYSFEVITFNNAYNSTPVVLATMVTDNHADDNSLTPVIDFINRTAMNISLCRDTGTASCNTTAVNETIQYFVFDINHTGTFDWLEINRTNVTTAGADTVYTFDAAFTNVPYVFATIQTNFNKTGMDPHIWTDTATTTNVQLLGCAHPGIADACTDSGTETAGFVIIDPTLQDINTLQIGSEDISNSLWTQVLFSPSFTNTAIMVMQNDDDGAQDPQYTMAREVNTTAGQIRYCEQDDYGVCHSHTSEFTRWMAVEAGNISVEELSDTDVPGSFVEYNEVFDFNWKNISVMNVTVTVSLYNNSGSNFSLTNESDLELQVSNGSGFVHVGNFSVNGTGNFTLPVTNAAILKAWENTTNTNLRIRGIYIDTNTTSFVDEINWTGVHVGFNGQMWDEIGQHVGGSTFWWDTSALPEEDGIDFRVRAFDNLTKFITGYFNKNAFFNISHVLIESVEINTTDPTKNGTNENVTIYPRNYPAGSKNITSWFVEGLPELLLNLPFEGGSNSISTKDYSGNNNSGRFNGSVSPQLGFPVYGATSGYDGFGAYNFSYTNNGNITINESELNLSGQNFSIEARFLTEGLNLFSNIILQGDLTASASTDGVSDVGVQLRSNGSTLFGRISNFSDSDELFGTTSIVDGAWHHVVFTVNSTTLSLYLDGVLDNTTARTLPVGAIQFDSNFGTKIGQQSGTVTAWNGTLDEIRIWNRTLSAEQVNALYQNRTNLIVSQETLGENWSGCVTSNDGSKDVLAYCSENLSINGAPVINLTHPPNGNSNASQNHTFVSSASDDTGLVNSTLYHNISGSWVANQTNSSITENPSNVSFQVDNIPFGTYEWNVQWCDDVGQCAQQVINFTFKRLGAPPTITSVDINSTDPSTNDTNQNITSYPRNVSDLDGDGVKNVTDWRLNGISFTSLYLPFVANGANESNLTKDYSTNQNNATVNNGTFFNVTRGYDGFGAYVFDGVDDFMDGVPNSTINRTEGTLTVWIRQADFINPEILVWAGDPDENGYSDSDGEEWHLSNSNFNASLNHSGFTFFYGDMEDDVGGDGGGPNHLYLFSGNVLPDTWYHVAVTWDFANNISRMYLNGTLVDSDDLSGDVLPYNTSNWQDNMHIGRPGEVTRHLNGTLSELRLYPRALSAEQIRAFMNNRTDLIVSQETLAGENWSACVTPNDRSVDGSTVCSANHTVITDNSPPPIPDLLIPPNNNVTTNRTPFFNWSDSIDPDGDPVNYTLNISCFPGCSSDNRIILVVNRSNFTLQDDLEFFSDDGFYYNWTVLATDGQLNSSFNSTPFRFDINTLIDISVPSGNISFGDLTPGVTNDTTDDSPNPFTLQNNGNLLIDINISGTDLWDTDSNPTSNYRYKVDNATGENNSFNWASSNTTFTNVPATTANNTFLIGLNHTDVTDSVEVDIEITVPSGEGAGFKNSILDFNAQRS